MKLNPGTRSGVGKTFYLCMCLCTYVCMYVFGVSFFFFFFNLQIYFNLQLIKYFFPKLSLFWSWFLIAISLSLYFSISFLSIFAPLSYWEGEMRKLDWCGSQPHHKNEAVNLIQLIFDNLIHYSNSYTKDPSKTSSF